jgi:ankyrin repeat protein
MLLEYKADVSTLARGKATPLHYAAREGPYETVMVLLEKGFSLSARDDLGNTPLHFAAQRGEVAIVEAMLKANADSMATNNADMTVLQTAVRAGKCEVAKMIMQATVRDQERAGGTALHIAVVEQNYAQVERLTTFAYTRAGARNQVGASPLLIAAKLGDVKMMKLLLAETKVTVETVLKDPSI